MGYRQDLDCVRSRPGLGMKLFWGSEGLALAARLRGVKHLVLTGVCYLGLYLDPYLLWYVHPALRQ
jgi:hypothetical protein